MKKILFVLHLPPPIHGVSQVNTIIKKSTIINNNLDCTYMNIATANEISDLGSQRIGKYLHIIKLIFIFLKKIIFNKYDLIYITPSIPGIGFYKDSIFVLLSKLFNKKVICHLHVQGFKKASKTSFKKSYYSFIFKNVDVIHLSESLYKDIETIVKRENVHFVANGVIPVPKSELIHTEREKNDKLEILFLSNMIEFKGPFLLLKAINELVIKYKGIKNIHVNFIGQWQDEEFKKNFLAFIKENKIENNVSILGGIYGNEKNKYFRNANLFILPTNFEAFPLVLLEAMEFSLPIISTKEGAIPDIVDDNKTGYIIEKNNLDELINKIDILLNDTKLSIDFGNTGREKFELNYTANIMEENIYNTIMEVLKND